MNSPARPPGLETPTLPTPVFDEAFHLRSLKDAALYAAYNIKVCGGNAQDLRALIDSKSYWETEALHYTALLHKYLDQVTDLASYWQQEAARQKEVSTLRVSLTKDHVGDQPENMRSPLELNEEADCIPERTEALYYTAIIRQHLDHAVDALPYWKEEAAYLRKALTEWVPSFKDCGDSLRHGIDQLEYWREESRNLCPIANRMVKELLRKQDELREDSI